MTFLQNLLDAVVRLLLWLAGVALVAMMFVTIVDVVIRNFGEYIPVFREIRLYGILEVVRYLFLVSMAGTMPWGVEKSQVIVELFTQKLSNTARARIDSFFLLGFTVFGGFMAYALVLSGVHAINANETTPDLGLPMSWIRFFAAFCMGLMALRALLIGIQGLRRGELHVA